MSDGYCLFSELSKFLGWKPNISREIDEDHRVGATREKRRPAKKRPYFTSNRNLTVLVAKKKKEKVNPKKYPRKGQL